MFLKINSCIFKIGFKVLKRKRKMAEGLVFREIKGDLFTAPDDFALAHCVPVSMTMGAGIARLFKYLLYNFTHFSD